MSIMRFECKQVRATLVVLMLVCSDLNGQVGPVENYLKSAEEKANRVVSNAGAQGKGVAMEAGQAVLNAIGAFRAAYADSLGATESALAKEQASLFRDIRSNVERLDEFLQKGTGDLQQVAATLAMSISNLPVGKDVPRVTQVGPLFVLAPSTTSAELIVKGFGLSNSDPFLTHNGVATRPNTETDTELRFTMPKLVAAGVSPQTSSMVLTLFEKQRRFLVLSSYVARTYPVGVTSIPSRLGDYDVLPRRRVPDTLQTPKETPEYRCDSPRGEGTNTVPVHVVPSQGWEIDVSTIHYKSSYSNHGSQTMNTSSPAGFTATLSCSGWGRIRDPLTGIVIDHGSIGVEKGTFTFTERRTTTKLVDGAKVAGTLNWGQAVTHSDLPSDTETAVVVVRFFNGESLAVDGAGSHPFASVSFNSASKVITITPRKVDDALRR